MTSDEAINPLRTSLRGSVLTFYPRSLTWGDADWLVSEEIFRLIQARRKAAHDYRLWHRFQDALKTGCGDFDFLDYTNFENDCCYEISILLHPGVKFLYDDRTVAQLLGGQITYLDFYVSCLGKWIYHRQQTMKIVDLSKDELAFTTSRDYSEVSQGLVAQCVTFWKERGYQDVPRDLAMEVMPDVETACQKMGQATVFHCLFSDNDSP